MTDATVVVDFLHHISEIMTEHKDYLIQIDGVVGDGDLGLTMSDGFTAAYEAVQDGTQEDIGKLLYTAGKAMSVKVPSTMGTLMAMGLMQAAKNLRGVTSMDAEQWVALFAGYEAGVTKLGKAKIGEKTFLDGFHPALESLQASIEEGLDLHTAAQRSAQAAEDGFHATVGMLAVHGRAATRGEESRKLEDPGAKVASLIFQAFAQTV